MLAAEIPEELLENRHLTVLQNESSLPQEEAEACWRLKEVFGKVVVRWSQNEAVREAKVKLGQERYLLFKLSGQNLDQGRLVRSPSSGSYLVIALEDWERDEELSGPPPVEPEPVSLDGYRAHFFDLGESGYGKIAFRLPDRESKIIESKAPRFELVGTRLEDASDRMGPLFGSGPPRIRALDTQAWEKVGTIVVGVEGSGRERWRTEYAPDPGRTEQDLPSELANRKSGWYFLRFYDADDDLIESLDFRFISSLKRIVLSESRPLPAENGHRPVYVEFLHEPDCSVQAVESPVHIQLDQQCDKTIATIPPHPTCDQSRWLVYPGDGSPVEVVILVERIWWAREDHIPSQWTDKPLKLSREDFAATSNQALWLRLPKCRWVDKVLVGFEQSRARPYNVMVTEKTVAIQLREFGDCAEVDDQTQEYSLKLWIKRDHQDMEGIFAILPASQVAVAPMPAPAVSPSTQSWVGWGRKKNAIAKAVIKKGTGEIKVNDRPVDDYFRQTPRKARQFLERLLDMNEVREALSRMEVNINVERSSPTSMRQAKAVAHAIAGALIDYDPRLMPLLRRAGFGGARVRAFKADRRDN